MTIVGRTYLERGEPVQIVAQWRQPPPGQFCAIHFSWLCQAGQGVCKPGRKNGPRNVAIRRQDGTVTVRPMRGLRLAESKTALTDRTEGTSAERSDGGRAG